MNALNNGTRAAGRNRILAAGLVAVVAAGLSACGSSGSSLPPAGGSSAGKGKPSALTQAQVVAAAPVAAASAITPGSWMDQIKKRGYLRVGGTDSGPLFSQKNPVSGQLEGFDAGLSQMLARYITGKPATKLSLTTVDTRETMLQNGTVDAVFATYTITPQRAQKVDFAGPYFESGDAIMVKSSNSSIKSVADLNGKTVATEGNSTAALDIKKFAPKAKVLLFQEDGECVAAVKQGRADAYVLDQGILLGDAVSDTSLKVVGQPFTQEPYGIGVPKGSAAKKFVDTWLQKIYADGEWAKLWKATIGTKIAGNPPAVPKIGSADGS
ncbi:glutamate ABC transporter substrate-binding protein [Streptomyces sp. SL13]|jgi:glutamate transport system substrate-binding protein|uniref:Glutamate ABC transporter substrate-binding protein n=1 Tax=Streptantibioticus silvisoli TaxID=2705255 RepID=A0AA90H5M7_9ACTN|nr:glutamate ABC transporter substrate-binding protein [Streptantibioticus silvisoli]MDI5961750.1 glutamate ABC transporter substrate-binding protein [Streptantibioticus silvisoli]MDI5972366.1 glutamate ABC transporter substrate-binding protein [Streptantibioticus silvisoli]